MLSSSRPVTPASNSSSFSARPPLTPPYLLLAFYTACALAALRDIALDLLAGSAGVLYYGSLVLHTLQLAVVSVLIWVAGTYPMRATWPGPNVAKPADVSSRSMGLSGCFM